MDTINALIDGLKLEEIIPPLEDIFSHLEPIVKWAVMAGPIVVLLLGLIYLLIPPKEANHSLGFRTYFSMGSIEAWRFTQRIAGLAMSALGLVLTVVMFIITRSFAGMDQFQMMQKAAKCLTWELILVVVVYLGVSILAAVFFDRNGERRFQK